MYRRRRAGTAPPQTGRRAAPLVQQRAPRPRPHARAWHRIQDPWPSPRPHRARSRPGFLPRCRCRQGCRRWWDRVRRLPRPPRAPEPGRRQTYRAAFPLVPRAGKPRAPGPPAAP
ncbi:MAG TPA: hypothetical protein ENH89_04460 [Aurantimonas coralicida]|uniref:Uncharacterized protein n=1 Tax=Aurantimonas coralicida TaxID=182270 RepID=A0A9C9TGE1_9HYPH|nr:hypothetical protein [Aurantimonas coralicida]